MVLMGVTIVLLRSHMVVFHAITDHFGGVVYILHILCNNGHLPQWTMFLCEMHTSHLDIQPPSGLILSIIHSI